MSQINKYFGYKLILYKSFQESSLSCIHSWKPKKLKKRNKNSGPQGYYQCLPCNQSANSVTNVACMHRALLFGIHSATVKCLLSKSLLRCGQALKLQHVTPSEHDTKKWMEPWVAALFPDLCEYLYKHGIWGAPWLSASASLYALPLVSTTTKHQHLCHLWLLQEQQLKEGKEEKGKFHYICNFQMCHMQCWELNQG